MVVADGRGNVVLDLQSPSPITNASSATRTFEPPSAGRPPKHPSAAAEPRRDGRAGVVTGASDPSLKCRFPGRSSWSHYAMQKRRNFERLTRQGTKRHLWTEVAIQRAHGIRLHSLPKEVMQTTGRKAVHAPCRTAAVAP